MNPERRDYESKTSNRPSKASTPKLKKYACFCPLTMHDTTLDHLTKSEWK